MFNRYNSGEKQNMETGLPPSLLLPFGYHFFQPKMSRAVNSTELASHSHFGLKITIKTQKTLCRLTTEEEKNPKHYVLLLFALLFNFQPKSFIVMFNKNILFS